MGLLDKLKNTKDKSKAVTKQSNLEVEKKEEKVIKKEEGAKTLKKAFFSGELANILVKPLVSEKSARSESAGVYTFVVKSKATKVDIKKAIKALYGILPAKVRVMNFEGKRKMIGRVSGKRSDWKKAVVTLPKGKNIDIHTGV